MKLFFLNLLILLGNLSYSQELLESEKIKPPNTYIDLSAGIGMNYGMSGVKGVFGYNGSGLLIGVGSINNQFALQIGIQLSYKFAYISISRGVYGTYNVTNTSVKERANGTIFIVGSKIHLNKPKTAFLDFGAGYAFGQRYKNENFERVKLKKLAYNAGIGFKFGKLPRSIASKNKRLPASIFDLSFGYGMNYGIAGIKSLIGYKGSGVYLGIGSGFKGQDFGLQQVGFQLSLGSFYINYGLGTYGSTNGDKEVVETLEGNLVMVGYQTSLNKKAKSFFDLGLGYGYGDNYEGEQLNKIIINIGIGIRIGNLSATANNSKVE